MSNVPLVDEVEYEIRNDHTGENLPVVGFQTALEEAYAQAIALPCFADVNVHEVAAEATVAKYRRDGYNVYRVY